MRVVWQSGGGSRAPRRSASRAAVMECTHHVNAAAGLGSCGLVVPACVWPPLQGPRSAALSRGGGVGWCRHARRRPAAGRAPRFALVRFEKVSKYGELHHSPGTSSPGPARCCCLCPDHAHAQPPTTAAPTGHAPRRRCPLASEEEESRRLRVIGPAADRTSPAADRIAPQRAPAGVRGPARGQIVSHPPRRAVPALRARVAGATRPLSHNRIGARQRPRRTPSPPGPSRQARRRDADQLAAAQVRQPLAAAGASQPGSAQVLLQGEPRARAASRLPAPRQGGLGGPHGRERARRSPRRRALDTAASARRCGAAAPATRCAPAPGGPPHLANRPTHLPPSPPPSLARRAPAAAPA